MAKRNPEVPHSIESLLFVNKNGKYCGYKQKLISDDISVDLREFLICSECKGIIRKARQRKGSTVCEMCVTGERSIDEKVGNKVASLNSKCPLSEEGCGWKGKVGEIEQHMELCLKVLVGCQQNCGILFERGTTDQHKEICPFRMIQCKYCKREVHVKEENQHLVVCLQHPYTEVPCPFKELGCEAIILRKNRDTHLSKNMVSHQKLMLNQLNQLRNINIAIVIGVIIAVIIGIAVAASQGNNIKANSQQIEYIRDNSAYIYEYVEARGKVLLGIEWIYDLKETGYFLGPTFYLKQCKLRLIARVWRYLFDENIVVAGYYVDRLEGKYDDSIDICKITYTYATYWYLDAIEPEYTYSSDSNMDLKVGNSVRITSKDWMNVFRKARVRFYFDTEGDKILSQE